MKVKVIKKKSQYFVQIIRPGSTTTFKKSFDLKSRADAFATSVKFFG